VFQGFAIGVMDHPQANLACFPAYGSDHRRTIIVIGAVSDLFISPAARWISRVALIVTFFPPPSETFHLLRANPRPGSIGSGDLGLRREACPNEIQVQLRRADLLPVRFSSAE
jgi:hypothetical protein